MSLLHNVTITSLSQKFTSFSPFNTHRTIYSTLWFSKLKLLPQNWIHYLCLNVTGVTLRDFFHPVSHFQLSKIYIKIIAICKIIVYPSAGTIICPVWRVLLAISVSQFGLSVYLNQVRHHPSSRSRKISSFPPWSTLCYGPSDWVSLLVQLHLNRLKTKHKL